MIFYTTQLASAKQCSACMEQAPTWIEFVELEGRPILCIRCFWERLGFPRRAYDPAMLQRLE